MRGSFVLLAILCSALGDAEMPPASSLTKFRDLTFFNNLVHFVGDNGPQEGAQPAYPKVVSDPKTPEYPTNGPNQKEYQPVNNPNQGGYQPVNSPNQKEYNNPNGGFQPGNNPSQGEYSQPIYNPNQGMYPQPVDTPNQKDYQPVAYPNQGGYPQPGNNPKYDNNKPMNPSNPGSGPNYGGGHDDSQNRKNEPQKNMQPPGNQGQEPKTLMSKTGVKVEVSKQKKVYYDTEFTLSLKWRPFNTARSIKKMLLFFPKIIEQSAFNQWENLRNGQGMKNTGARPNNAANAGDKGQSTYSPRPMDENMGCKGGNCNEQPEQIETGKDGMEGDHENEGVEENNELDENGQNGKDGQSEESAPTYPNDSNDSNDSNLANDSNISNANESDGSGTEDSDDDESEYDTDHDSGDEWSYDDYSDDPGSSKDINRHREPPQEYPFFVRLSSYDPNMEVVDDFSPRLLDDPGSARASGPGPKSPTPGISQRPGFSPSADVKALHKKKKARHRPAYVLVDSDILVNTVCPHMLNDFKSSPQQWGKKKSVSVKVSNTTANITASHAPQPKPVFRYFPGDHVSKGSVLRGNLATLVLTLSSLISL